MRRQSLLAASLLAIVTAVVLAAPAAPAQDSSSVADLSWMQGTWVTQQDGQRLEEIWSSPADGGLVGMFRWNRGGKPWMCEFMTITLEDGKPVFRLRHFDPALKPWEKESPLTYPMKNMSASEVVFEDPDNAADHPRRFIYTRTGDSLRVRLENADGTGDSFDFALASGAGAGGGAGAAAKPKAEASSPLGFEGGLVLRFQVTDRAKSRDWYRDMLGFEVLFEVDEIGWTEMTSREAKLTIGLSQSDAANASTGTVPVVGVRDLDAARTHLESKGVKFTGPTIEHTGLVRLATLLDPDGHQIMLYQALGG